MQDPEGQHLLGTVGEALVRDRQLRRLKFGKKSEQLDAEQRALFDETLDADIAAAQAQLQELLDKKKPPVWESSIVATKTDSLPPGQ
ncbi:transposase domain-containing protein [Roseateles sp. MS654]|uniref:transposase domain-containing protein n=1 Tax=Roseateles sp. MS654 TaxID=3412685 RepID=UPI003C2D4DBC